MRAVEEVSLYSVLLREAARNHHAHELCHEEAFDDRAELSFATLLYFHHFTDLDWLLVELLIDHPSEVLEVAQVLYGEHEQPLESEALLHAVEPHGKRTTARWASPFRVGGRWGQVRSAMRAFEREGITTRFIEVDLLADATFRERTGATDDEIWEIFTAPSLDVLDGIVPTITLSQRRTQLLNYGGRRGEK